MASTTFHLKVTALADEAMAKKLASEAEDPPGAIEVMSMCCAELTQKYDWLARCSPEGLLAVAGVTWLAKDVSLMKRLGELETLKKTALSADPGTKN